MSSRATIRWLLTLCVTELAVIVFLVVRQSDVLMPVLLGKPFASRSTVTPAPAMIASPVKPVAPVPEKVAAMEKELAEVKHELDVRKSEISFSYGTLRDSGQFVGMTFRKMFEAAAAGGADEAKAKTADNQINVLSLGPFIQDAEVMEADPASFAQFQSALIGEVLSLPTERRGEIEGFLADLKTQALKVEEGSPEWVRFNETAYQRISGMLSPSQQQTLKPQLAFLQSYGVLMIPAYSILRAPVPTIAPLASP